MFSSIYMYSSPDFIGFEPEENYQIPYDPDFEKIVNDIVERKLADRRPVISKVNNYEVTLTTAGDDPHKLVASMYKIIESKMTPDIISYTACLELTAAGKPHIHMLLTTEGKILPSRLRKIYKERFSCEKVRNIEAFKKYILKEEQNVNVINYCKEKECLQFYTNVLI